jgi:hypothetical protein
MSNPCPKHNTFDPDIKGCPACREVNILQAENTRLREVIQKAFAKLDSVVCSQAMTEAQLILMEALKEK